MVGIRLIVRTYEYLYKKVSTFDAPMMFEQSIANDFDNKVLDFLPVVPCI